MRIFANFQNIEGINYLVPKIKGELWTISNIEGRKCFFPNKFCHMPRWFKLPRLMHFLRMIDQIIGIIFRVIVFVLHLTFHSLYLAINLFNGTKFSSFSLPCNC